MPGVLGRMVARLKRRQAARSRSHSLRDGLRALSDDSNSQTDNVITANLRTFSLQDFHKDPMQAESSQPPPRVFGQPGFTYEFTFSPHAKAWPGPSYDETSLYAPGCFDNPRTSKRRSKPKSSKRRLSQDHRQATHIPPLPPSPPPFETTSLQFAKMAARQKKAAQPKPQYFGSAPPRDPPLHLLSLPGEIRNHIYRLLCVSDEPLYPCFRLIIKPKQGRKKQSDTYRRFPREPVLALVCRQLEREALSLFYSENTFTFCRKDPRKVPAIELAPNMTRESFLLRWRPQRGLADNLTHLELQLFTMASESGHHLITYTFRKSSDGELHIEYDASLPGYCLCAEDKVVEELRQNQLRQAQGPRDLIAHMSDTLTVRRRLLMDQWPCVVLSGNSSFRVLPCQACGLKRFRDAAMRQ